MAPPLPPEQYEAAYVQALFDEMAASYDLVNTLTSFGFSVRWRRQSLGPLGLRPGARVADLMCGMGENWAALSRVGGGLTVSAVDFSAGMCRGARARSRRHPELNLHVLREDATQTGLPDGDFDAVLCSFGLKTLNAEHTAALAWEVRRLLKPGGTFSLIEVSVPPSLPLRLPYLWYLERVIPVLGRLLLGHPENYRMLGRYTRAFGDSRRALAAFEAAGLEVEFRSYFFGCATGVVGRKSRPTEVPRSYRYKSARLIGSATLRSALGLASRLW